jgi:iron(III) transport system substrate-binding protein
MKTRAKVVLALAFLFFATVISFAQSTDPKIIEAAKKDGEIVWYTSMAVDQSQPLMNAFQKKYPAIKPTLVRLGGGALMNRVLTETRAGRFDFDVVGGRGEMIQIFKERGIIAPYISPETKLIDPDLFDKQGFWYVHYVVPWALGYNTTQVKKEEVPKTYEALLDPKWKGGKLSMDNEGYLVLQGLMTAWGKEKAIDYMKKLAALDPVLMRGNTERVTFAGAGQYALILAYAHTLEREKFKGAPIDWIPLEPAVVEIDPQMIGAKAPHPNAARLFMDYILSKEGQEMLVEFQRIPVRKDVEPKPARLFRGYQRIVEKPDDYKYFSDNVKLYQEIFKTR